MNFDRCENAFSEIMTIEGYEGCNVRVRPLN